MLPMATTRPQPRCSIGGTRWRHRSTIEDRFAVMCTARWSAPASCHGRRRSIAALATSTSMRPKRASASVASADAAPGTRKSASNGRVAPEGCDRGAGGLSALGVAEVMEDDVGALPRQPERDCAADAGVGARDERLASRRARMRRSSCVVRACDQPVGDFERGDVGGVEMDDDPLLGEFGIAAAIAS